MLHIGLLLYVVSRMIWCRIRNFLTYRIAATLQLVCFFFIAVFAFKPQEFMPSDWEAMYVAGKKRTLAFIPFILCFPLILGCLGTFPDAEIWPSFFHMPVLMLMLITLLNDGTLITIGYDNVFVC